MTQSGHLRAPAIWLLVAAALLLRAAVPVGWMPVAGDGELRVMLCSGAGPVEIVPQAAPADHSHHASGGHHMPGDSGNSEDSGHGHDPCPYGLALGQSLDLPDIAIPLLLPETGTQLSRPMPAAARLAVRRGIRPPSRGPPALA